MSKRILSLVLALVMVLGTFGTVFAAPTDNVKVDWLIEEGLVQGYGDGTYGLDKAITRAEVTAIVTRALDLEDIAKASAGFASPFKDMNAPAVMWARGYVTVIAGQGIVEGYPNGEFRPANPITYAEISAMMVRLMGGLTEAEEANAVWPTTYLAKAVQLGVYDGITGITDYNTAATREKVFEMIYNAIISKQIGNYTIVKGIVLENNRVEKLTNDNEIVVEVLKEIQTSNFASASRYEKGNQEKFAIEAKVGDVEYLLGKVADFTLDKDNKVINVKVDDSYEYWQGPISATKNKVNNFTVELDERYKDKDERIFRTYHNDKPLSYEDFYKVVERDKITLDFAKVTTKNGKVLFIDSFTFDDIAPVQEVKRDGLDVYVYNDYRDARVEKFEPRALVLGFDAGRFSRMDRKDIKTNDVVHVYEKNRMIVRTDAAIKGEYQKVERNRDGEYHAFIEGEKYLINDMNYRRPVFAHDSKAFTTLYAERASQELKDFFKEEVNILLDINNDLQLFGAEVEWNEGMAIVKQVLAKGQVKLVKADNEEAILDEDYSSMISFYDWDANKATINQRLAQFNTQDLTFMLGNDTKIDTLVRIATREKMMDEAEELLSAAAVNMNNSFIRMKDNSRYQVLDRTNVFHINKAGVITAGTVAKYQAALVSTGTVKAYVLSDADVTRIYDVVKVNDRHRITTKSDIAHTIVFVDLELAAADTQGEVILVDRVYTATTPHYVIGQLADSKGKTTVERTAARGVNLRNMLPNDIVSLNLSKDDDKLVRSFDVLIAGDKVKTESYKVVGGDLRYSNSEFRRLYLQDAQQLARFEAALTTNPRTDVQNPLYSTEKWLVRGTEEFGTITVDSVVTFHETKNNDIDVIRVYGKNTPVTANGIPAAEKTGLVTYINATASRMIVDGVLYVLDADSIVRNDAGIIQAIGSLDIVAKSALVEGNRVKDIVVNNGVIVSVVRTSAVVVDRTALMEQLALAAALTEANYTPETWLVLNNALIMPELTQAEVNAKTIALSNALAGLVVKDGVVTATYEKLNFLGADVVFITLSDDAELTNVTKVTVNGADKAFTVDATNKVLALTYEGTIVINSLVLTMADGSTVVATK